MTRPVSLNEFDHMQGISTKCFTYNSADKTFVTEMSELGFIDGDDFLINGKLCRSNGHLTINDKNRFGSMILKSSRTGIRAFFTFDHYNKDDEGEVTVIVYRYFAADNDKDGKNPILRQCTVHVVND